MIIHIIKEPITKYDKNDKLDWVIKLRISPKGNVDVYKGIQRIFTVL